MAGLPLHYIDLRVFSYVTEDDELVEGALRTLLPEEAEIERAVTEGHYGDPILVLSSRIETADEQRHVLDQLGTSDVVEQLRTELDDRVTADTELYCSLDKQAAAAGRVEVGRGITVRAKLEAYPATRENALESAEEVLSYLSS